MTMPYDDLVPEVRRERVWFTADTHFFHDKILWLGNGRPFGSVEEMNEALIERWNERVAKGDRVYHLGDFSFGKRDETAEVIRRLNGQIHVVRGNHDGSLDRLSSMFTSYSQYKEVTVEGQKLILFHFPIDSWHRVGKGSLHLHGHSHGLLPDNGSPRMDVGVDPNGYAPVSFDEVIEKLLPRVGQWVPGDHHGSSAYGEQGGDR